MGKELPAISDVETPLSHDEYKELEDAFNKELENGGIVDPQTAFNFGWAQIKSDDSRLQKEGLRLLVTIFKTEPSRRRECLWYISLGNYRIGSYKQAHHYVEVFRRYDPDNAQAKALSEAFESKIRTEGMLGIGLVALTASAVGVTVAALMMKGRR